MDNKLRFFSSMVLSRNVMKAIFAGQNLAIPEPVNGEYVETNHEFVISDSYIKEWNDLLQSGGSETVIPYTYYWPWAMKFTMKHLLPDLGLNLSNVLHLGHEGKFYDEFDNIAGVVHKMRNRLVDLCPLREDRIVIVTETSIMDKKDNLIFKAKDYTMVLNMKPKETALLNESPAWNNARVPLMDESFRKKESRFQDDTTGKWLSFYCKDTIASEFGHVSGALSITHATVLTARYFRQGKVFLQGMCTGNIILKLLYVELGERLSDFSVFFTNQLVFPQRVELRYDDTRFEMFDEGNIMVAYGERKQRVVH